MVKKKPQEMLLLWKVNPIAISHLLQKTPAELFLGSQEKKTEHELLQD